MKKQQVQVAGLEPSTVGSKATYAIQIRGVDAEGNYGAWSKAFVFDSGSDLPFDLEEGVDEIQAGDVLFYDGSSWIGFSAAKFARTDEPTFFSFPPTSPEPQTPEQLTNKSYVDNREVIPLDSDTIELDFSERDQVITRQCEGNVVITGVNYEPAASKTIRFIAGANDRAFVFPSSWKFLGDAPSQVDAGKTGVLTITCFSDQEQDVVAAWGQQS